MRESCRYVRDVYYLCLGLMLYCSETYFSVARSLTICPSYPSGRAERKHEFVAANVPLNLTEWRFR